MAFGLTVDGFIPQTLVEIKAGLEASFKAAFGDSIDVSPESAFGQIIGVMAERFSDLWELGEAVNASTNPDAATGVNLEAVCALTGTFRKAATYSAVSATATGTPGTLLPTGRVASVAATRSRFASTAPVTIAAVGAWVASTAYILGQMRSNSGNVYLCVTAGTSAGSGGPTGAGTAIIDGTTVWKYLGAGIGAISVPFKAEATGPTPAVSGTLNAIETAVSGWSNVVNLLDADLGSDLETDAALRIRREQELRATGKSALDAIRSELLQVVGVTAVTVFENTTDAVDADGLPPHSVEALVQGGTVAAVAAGVFAAVAAGIGTYGTVTSTVTDSQLQAHTVKFSRPVEQNIWVIVNATVDADFYPTDGDTQIKNALVAYGDAFATGKNAVSSGLSARVFKVSGVLDATVLIGLSNPPTLTVTIPIGLRELAKFDTSRITVNTTPGIP